MLNLRGLFGVGGQFLGAEQDENHEVLLRKRKDVDRWIGNPGGSSDRLSGWRNANKAGLLWKDGKVDAFEAGEE